MSRPCAGCVQPSSLYAAAFQQDQCGAEFLDPLPGDSDRPPVFDFARLLEHSGDAHEVLGPARLEALKAWGSEVADRAVDQPGFAEQEFGKVARSIDAPLALKIGLALSGHPDALAQWNATLQRVHSDRSIAWSLPVVQQPGSVQAAQALMRPEVLQVVSSMPEDAKAELAKRLDVFYLSGCSAEDLARVVSGIFPSGTLAPPDINRLDTKSMATRYRPSDDATLSQIFPDASTRFVDSAEARLMVDRILIQKRIQALPRLDPKHPEAFDGKQPELMEFARWMAAEVDFLTELGMNPPGTKSLYESVAARLEPAQGVAVLGAEESLSWAGRQNFLEAAKQVHPEWDLDFKGQAVNPQIARLSPKMLTGLVELSNADARLQIDQALLKARITALPRLDPKHPEEAFDGKQPELMEFARWMAEEVDALVRLGMDGQQAMSLFAGASAKLDCAQALLVSVMDSALTSSGQEAFATASVPYHPNINDLRRIYIGQYNAGYERLSRGKETGDIVKDFAVRAGYSEGYAAQNAEIHRRAVEGSKSTRGWWTPGRTVYLDPDPTNKSFGYKLLREVANW